MRAVLLIAVSLIVLVSSATVRVTEIDRSVVNDGASYVFTTRNTDVAARGDVFLVKADRIVRRSATGVQTTILDYRAANFTGLPRAAAIHPTRRIFVLAYTRPANRTESIGFWARNDTTAFSAPAPNISTLVWFNFNANNTVDVASATTIIRWGTFGQEPGVPGYDIGTLKFNTTADGRSLLYFTTGNNYPLFNGIWDFFQQGRDLGNYQGKLFRFDLDQPFPYIPLDNPYLNSTVRNAVYATGFAWPRSIAFAGPNVWLTDASSGVADEVNLILPGGGVDYGWNVLEGNQCVQPPVNCSSANTVLPHFAINVPPQYASSINYGISGLAHLGQGQFLASWNGGEGVIRHLNATSRTVEDVRVVDERGVVLRWYYGSIEFAQLQNEGPNEPIYVLGSYPANNSHVLFRLEVEENSAAKASVLVALLIAVLAALLH